MRRIHKCFLLLTCWMSAVVLMVGLTWPVTTGAKDIAILEEQNSLPPTEYNFPCQINFNGNWKIVKQRKGFTTDQQLLDNINNIGRFGHGGTWPQIDLNANNNNVGPRTYGICEDTTLRAAKDGTVATFQWENGGGGNVLKVSHGSQTSVYAHLPANGNHVSLGASVSEGQDIGVMGCSGACDGTHVHFAVDGSGGNWKFRLPSSTAPDTVPPTITFGPAPQTNRWYNTDQRIEWTISDGGSGVRGFKQAWNTDPGGQEYATNAGHLDLSWAGEGWHTVRVRAWDNAGNQTIVSNESYGPLGYDITMPTGNLNEPLNGSVTNNTNFTLKANAADGLSGVKEVTFHALYDGSWHPLCSDTTVPYECSWTVPAGVPDQTIFFSTHVVDNATNEKVDPGGYRAVTLDRVAPTGSVALNNDWDSADGLAMPLKLTANGTGSAVRQVRTSADGTTWGAWQPMASSVWAILNGQHGSTATVYVQYRDAAGNVSATITGNITLDFYPDKPQSANYRIQKDVVAMNGGSHQSANYQLNGTLGQAVTNGGSSSANYNSTWGYWSSLDSIIEAIKRVFIPLVQK